MIYEWNPMCYTLRNLDYIIAKFKEDETEDSVMLYMQNTPREIVAWRMGYERNDYIYNKVTVIFYFNGKDNTPLN